jgi:hypothetical protein
MNREPGQVIWKPLSILICQKKIEEYNALWIIGKVITRTDPANIQLLTILKDGEGV